MLARHAPAQSKLGGSRQTISFLVQLQLGITKASAWPRYLQQCWSSTRFRPTSNGPTVCFSTHPSHCPILVSPCRLFPPWRIRRCPLLPTDRSASLPHACRISQCTFGAASRQLAEAKRKKELCHSESE